jgi:hypothetical protein
MSGAELIEVDGEHKVFHDELLDNYASGRKSSEASRNALNPDT